MYPDQPQQSPPPAPYDYLNQIAPQAPKKSPFSFGIKQAVLIGAALVILMIILVSVLNIFTTGKKEPYERLSARLNSTATIVDDSQKSLKSSKLRSLNSNLRIYMTNTTRDITTPLTNVDIDMKKLDKNIIAEESTTALAARLEDARLNAVFHRTYAREMAYQLGNLMTLMKEIYNSTNSTSMKEFTKSSYDNLESTQAAFANFSTAE